MIKLSSCPNLNNLLVATTKEISFTDEIKALYQEVKALLISWGVVTKNESFHAQFATCDLDFHWQVEDSRFSFEDIKLRVQERPNNIIIRPEIPDYVPLVARVLIQTLVSLGGMLRVIDWGDGDEDVDILIGCDDGGHCLEAIICLGRFSPE